MKSSNVSTRVNSSTSTVLAIILSGMLMLAPALLLQSANAATAHSCAPLDVAAVLADEDDGNVPDNTLDDDLSTRWSSHGIGSWIRYDLGQNTEICDVGISWYNGDKRQNDFVISASTDGATYKDVYSGKSSGTTLNEELYDFADDDDGAAITARYIQVTVNGNTDNLWASITETNIYGTSNAALSFEGLSEGQTLTGSIYFTIKASDPDKVDNVKAYVDGTTLLKEERYDPYDFPLKTSSFSSGEHTVDAIATLKDGSDVRASISVVFGESTSTTTTTTATSTNSNPAPTTDSSSADDDATDKFGVKMIYPTRSSGEQWFMNMDNPSSDSRFDPKDNISENADGSWKIESDQVRMNVFTSSGYHPERISTYDQQELATKGYMQDANDWRNIEMTGFVKVAPSASDDQLTWYARGGKHTDSNGGCEGTAYKGRLFFDGEADFAKEQQHSDGYSSTNNVDATGSIIGKWVGFKAVMYNDAQGNVVIQSWINENADKVTWKKVAEKIDSGGWGSDGDMCGGLPDQKITWGGPISTFRWDDATDVDFKWLSVREIQPPV